MKPNFYDILYTPLDTAPMPNIDLDKMYQNPNLSDAEKTVQKAALYASLKDRIEASDIVLKERFLWAATHGTWNNARMIQYQAYNTEHRLFAALMAQSGGDIPLFIKNIQKITSHQKNPFVALSDALVQSP